jgi:hypothetical protein
VHTIASKDKLQVCFERSSGRDLSVKRAKIGKDGFSAGKSQPPDGAVAFPFGVKFEFSNFSMQALEAVTVGLQSRS